MKRILPIFVILLLSSTYGTAQTTLDGRKVKRITFNQEQVSIEYADGTTDEGVKNVNVKRNPVVTDIVAAKPAQSMSSRQYYTIDGRPLQRAPREKGVYIVRDKKGAKKTIKK